MEHPCITRGSKRVGMALMMHAGQFLTTVLYTWRMVIVLSYLQKPLFYFSVHHSPVVCYYPFEGKYALKIYKHDGG